MKLCGTCKGTGEIEVALKHSFAIEICNTCDGEGIDGHATFTVGKVQRRKSAEHEVEQKHIKFDKKNASRSL
ncbi:hypothetical protein BSK59_16055 [Paenibacillus odorifer]|uniref:hypothetical protein n=1 Tax=Paenibacillus odorifer TaxID=189426 RepID=UPI00096F18CE|nr:hypothetical protein [Paenibacillus odorifer]OME54093.1 hypothetical protein BSK59_16055 [Paenibacillus odorifer]